MGKWIQIIKRFLVDSVFERIREYAHQIAWPGIAGLIMENYNPSLTTVVLVSILFVTICIRLWYKPKAVNDDKLGRWISWSLATTIIRDHPAGRKYMPDRPIFPVLNDLEAAAGDRSLNYTLEMKAAQGILKRIVKAHPDAKRGDGDMIRCEYLEHVIENWLDDMMLDDNGS